MKLLFRTDKAKTRPAMLLERPESTVEEFVALHFPSGPRRDAARRLWRTLESELLLDLSGLHPEDDLMDVLELKARSRPPEVRELIFRSFGFRPLAGGLGSFRRVVNEAAREVPERVDRVR